MSQIRMVNGDHKIFEITVTGDAGNVVDISNYEAYFTIKKRPKDTDYLVQKSTVNGGIVKTDALNGIMEVTLLSADTVSFKEGTYYYDVELRDASGEKYTIVPPSKFVIIKGVTE